MNLTQEQIDTLTDFKGWSLHNDSEYREPHYRNEKGYHQCFPEHVERALTYPETLIDMRLQLMELYKEQVYTHYDPDDLIPLILNKKYTEAAIKTAEIIKKLKS